MYDQDTFSEMINDWICDNAEEMEDLETDSITRTGTGWEATAHDNACTYLLSDGGDGNIIINYLGSLGSNRTCPDGGCPEQTGSHNMQGVMV